MERRICFKLALASSLISSSSRMHLRISDERREAGSRREKNMSRQSSASSALSLRPYAFMRPAHSRRRQIRKSSPLPNVAAISSRLRESLTGWQNSKEGFPFLIILENAAAVCSCSAFISSMPVLGFNFLHRSLPLKEDACPISSSIILSYSNFANVFLFIITPSLSHRLF